MQNNADLFTPLPVDMATPNGLLYQLNDSDKYLKTNELYTFEMDCFTVPEIDDMPASLNALPEEIVCPLIGPPLEPLFSAVEQPTTVAQVGIEERSVPVKQFVCDLCSETFPSVQVLRLHRRVQHISSKEFRCRKCPNSFNFKSNLVLHMASHVPSCSTNKECPECKMVFKRLSSFKGHLKSHQTSDRFKCNRCDKEFDLKGYYEKHMTKVHKPGADGTVEEILAKVATSARCRIKTKQSRGKHSCATCGKNFPKPCLLKRHEVCHSGAKPFQCTECDQGFTQKTSLARHMLLHEGVKDYKCPKCNCSFAQKNNLIVHIKRTHPSTPDLEKMFACPYCPCVFTKLNSVNRHKAMMHPERKNLADNDGFNDDDDDSVNVARVMEQLKSFQESMGIMAMQPPALELSMMKPPSPGPKVRTVTLVDTLNPQKEKTYKMAKEILYKDQRTMACLFCDKPFKKQFDLLRHHRTHTKEKPFECALCNKCFSTSAALKVHQNVHISENEKPAKVYKCTADECGKRFSSIRRLDIHTRTHGNSITYVCPVCSKSFTSKAGFSAHKHDPEDKEFDMIRPLLKSPVKVNLNVDEEEYKAEKYANRPHQCYFCGLKMQKLSHLRQHEASHRGQKPYKCTVCFRDFTTQSSLNLHSKIHTADKPYACKICGVKFITQSLLKRHMISHTNERNFACPYCSERFKTSSNCKNHILTHARNLLVTPELPQATGEESLQTSQTKDGEIYELSLPEATISQPCVAVVQSSLKHSSPKFIHLEMVKKCRKHNHKNLTIETVDTSPSKKAYKKAEALLLNHPSSNRHRCNECKKVFSKASDLERHLRTHTKEKPFECNLCEKRFALMSTLVQHRKTHDTHRETFGCQVCGKQYASKKVLAVHLRIHSGDRPFHCSLCKKSFRTSGHKISHMKAHHKKKKQGQT